MYRFLKGDGLYNIVEWGERYGKKLFIEERIGRWNYFLIYRKNYK